MITDLKFITNLFLYFYFLQKHFFHLVTVTPKNVSQTNFFKKQEITYCKTVPHGNFCVLFCCKKIATCQTILSYSSSFSNATNAVIFWFCSIFTLSFIISNSTFSLVWHLLYSFSNVMLLNIISKVKLNDSQIYHFMKHETIFDKKTMQSIVITLSLKHDMKPAIFLDRFDSLNVICYRISNLNCCWCKLSARAFSEERLLAYFICYIAFSILEKSSILYYRFLQYRLYFAEICNVILMISLK